MYLSLVNDYQFVPTKIQLLSSNAKMGSEDLSVVIRSSRAPLPGPRREVSLGASKILDWQSASNLPALPGIVVRLCLFENRIESAGFSITLEPTIPIGRFNQLD